MSTNVTSLKTKLTLIVGTTLTVIGGAAFAAITATNGTFSGNVSVAGTMSSAIINLQGTKSGSTSVLCIKTTGVIGRCTSAVAGDSECTCS